MFPSGYATIARRAVSYSLILVGTDSDPCTTHQRPKAGPANPLPAHAARGFAAV